MSKYESIKEWFSVIEAATKLGCSKAEIFQFALQGVLKLSVRFQVPAVGRIGKVWLSSEYQEKDAGCNHTPYRFMGASKLTLSDGKVLMLGSDIESMTGMSDLAMIGDERLAVESEYNKEISGVAKTLKGTAGVFVEGSNSKIYRLYRPAIDSDFEQYEEKNQEDWPSEYREGTYCPLWSFPALAEFVIRPKALLDFEVKSPDAVVVSTSTLSQTKKINNLLKICLTMAIDKYNYNPNDQKSKVPKAISDATQRLGVCITSETIRKRLDEGVEFIDQDKIEKLLKNK